MSDMGGNKQTVSQRKLSEQNVNDILSKLTKCSVCSEIFSIGLSRERVRQVGLVALEKLKKAAKTRKMEAMLLKH